MARKLTLEQLPPGWSYKLLDECAERCSGHTPSKSHPEYWNDGIKWISLTDTYRLDKGLVTATDKEISSLGIKNSSAQIHPAGTVVLSRDAGVGKSGVMAEPMAVSQHFIAWKCDTKKIIDKWFLYNWLQLNKGEFERQAVGSTIKTIGLPFFKKLKIAFPPLPEQQKIAQILSTWDKAITTTEQLIANSKQQKNALMQQLLTGKKRLVNPETGDRFEGKWLDVHMGDICQINPKKTAEPENGLVSFIPMDAVSEDAKLLRTEVKNYSDVSKGFTSFKDSDTLIAKITPCFENGKGAQVNQLENGIGFGSTEFHVLRAKNGISAELIYFLTNTTAFRVRGELNMQGSAGQKRVTTDYLKLYKVFIPKQLKEQQKIASVLTAADKEIKLLEAKLAHFKQEKKALMQQLLTGKRRVKVAQQAA
ncbi:restriction endonuclease subunit S [Photobacterium chitinilyticum]|uniref:Restriction endonuclease subunit S n=1 Tax=Photobacterium chitinilyticum TaxID=2485123 RepID=A0A3S3RE59_9GAMM|nr:restriction endonuclease subunit S [Photobacterium chitinilyticum]RWX52893.1 restriction endonuclease subunit S [Photobacterium chitinilyticum]